MGTPTRQEREEQVMSEKHENQISNRASYMGTGFLIGAAAGVALGVMFGVVLDNMAFMTIGIAIGACLGVAIGGGLYQRHKQDDV